MAKTLDRNRPFGTICGAMPASGARYEQDGSFFDADGQILSVVALQTTNPVDPPDTAVNLDAVSADDLKAMFDGMQKQEIVVWAKNHPQVQLTLDGRLGADSLVARILDAIGK